MLDQQLQHIQNVQQVCMAAFQPFRNFLAELDGGPQANQLGVGRTGAEMAPGGAAGLLRGAALRSLIPIQTDTVGGVGGEAVHK